jgi:tetratricopeptide (TPR) repeat protein
MATDEYKTSALSSSVSPCTDTAATKSESRSQENFQFSVQELMNLGRDAADRRDYILAAKYFQAAVSVLEDQYKVTNVSTDVVASPSSLPSIIEYELAVASSHLGRCCIALGLTEDALHHYQQELHYKRLYYNYVADGNDDCSASSNEENSIEGSHKELRNINLDLVLSIERVGEALILVGDYKAAKRHYHEALDMKRLVYGKEQKQSGQNPNEAQPTELVTPSVPNISSIRSLESFKPTVYGYDRIQNTDIAHTNVQLGIICQYLRQFHKARNYYTAALSMYRAVYSKPNEYNSASINKFQKRVHGDKRETFDIVEVKSMRPPTSKETAVESDLICNVKHIDIVKVLAQLGLVNAILNKNDFAKQYFDEASTMIRQLIDDCDKDLQEKVVLYETTQKIIQQEYERCTSKKRDTSENNHHPITWSQASNDNCVGECS